jgi:hexosaminidase
MTEQEKAHVLGVQANLWTEYIATESHLQYMLLPRMAALSEVQWCQPENKSWERFYNSADAFCAIYDAMGYNYGKHIFEVKAEVKINKEKGCVEVGLQAQGNTPIRYTLDGSEPEAASSLYIGPIEIRESCILKAKSDKNDKVYEKTFTAHKAMGRPVVVLTETHPSYKFNCPDLLTDGITGKGPYNSGDYAGWYNKPFEAVIDMGGQTFSNVTLSTFVYKYDYIFNPLDLTVYTSENGEDFTELAHTEFPVEGKVDDGNGCQKFNITIPETSAKYLKVTANTIKALPEWHSGKGRPGFVFVDEVMVD